MTRLYVQIKIGPAHLHIINGANYLEGLTYEV